MSTRILFGQEAKDKLIIGITVVVKAVKKTIGPRGLNWIIDILGLEITTNDGRTVANSIVLKDKFENIGVKVIQKIVNEISLLGGDATSTGTILGGYMIIEGMNHIQSGLNVVAVKEGMDKTVIEAISLLKKASKKATKEDIENVAIISSESETLGKIVADTVQKVGIDGEIDVTPVNSDKIEVKQEIGMVIDEGLMQPFMVNNLEKREAEYLNAHILITDKTLNKQSDIADMENLLNNLGKAGTPYLIVICNGLEGDALKVAYNNRMNGKFNIIGIKIPSKEVAEDLAITLGATLVSDALGHRFSDITQSMLGKVDKIISTQHYTTFIGGKGKKKDIDTRVRQLKAMKVPPKERIAKILGGIVSIKLPVISVSEMKYLKLKVENAINATKLAIQDGVIVGGGTTMAKISQQLTKPIDMEHLIGYDIVRKALQAPLREIVTNAGANCELIVDKVINSSPKVGYDAKKNEMVNNMYQKGIVNSAQTEIIALQIASSEAGIFITSGGTITDELIEKE